MWAVMIERPGNSTESPAAEATAPPGSCSSQCASSLTSVWFVQGLEDNLREAQGAAQRLESHLKQKEKLYEDKIKVK